MPTATYEELLIETLPQVIETEAQYRQIAPGSATWSAKAGPVRQKKPNFCACWPCWLRITTAGTRYRLTRALPPKSYSSSWSTPGKRQKTSSPFSDSAAM